jgi:hypothetical protein
LASVAQPVGPFHQISHVEITSENAAGPGSLLNSANPHRGDRITPVQRVEASGQSPIQALTDRLVEFARTLDPGRADDNAHFTRDIIGDRTLKELDVVLDPTAIGLAHCLIPLNTPSGP